MYPTKCGCLIHHYNFIKSPLILIDCYTFNCYNTYISSCSRPQSHPRTLSVQSDISYRRQNLPPTLPIIIDEWMNISEFKVSLESFADGDESSYVATDMNDSDKRQRTLWETSNNDQSSIEHKHRRTCRAMQESHQFISDALGTQQIEHYGIHNTYISVMMIF